MEDLLRVRQFAEAANLREATVRSWVLYRKIAVIRLGGRAIRIPKSELTRLINEGMVPAREQR